MPRTFAFKILHVVNVAKTKLSQVPVHLILQFCPKIAKAKTFKVKLFKVMNNFNFMHKIVTQSAKILKAYNLDYIEHKFLHSLKNKIQHANHFLKIHYQIYLMTKTRKMHFKILNSIKIYFYKSKIRLLKQKTLTIPSLKT